jgi:hypothetical protein
MAADVNGPDSYEPTGNWSSFSTPTVAGVVGLLVQKARQEPGLSLALSRIGGNSLMKAILMNSATKLPYWHKGRLEKDDDHEAPLDYVQGAGMLDAVGAYMQLTAGPNKPGDVCPIAWDLNYLEKRERVENVYQIALPQPADKIITITAAWNRHYTRSLPFVPIRAKDTNLRLELWAVDKEDPNNDYLLDYSDSCVDNVEHIYCRADANYTNYEIVLSMGDADDPNYIGTIQHYGLAWNIADAPESEPIFWYDLNADGVVDDSDLATLINYWIAKVQTPGSYFLGDINTNGAFDVNDVEAFLQYKDTRADWYKEPSTAPEL